MQNNIGTTRKFPFETLDAYQVAHAALGKIVAHKGKLRGLPGEVASQLERAAVSVVANICEASGRVSLADRRNRYAIARGEANEVGGCLAIVQLYGAFSDDDYAWLRESYLRVANMLTGLIKRR
jgi:four helix bundle protein